MSRIVYQLIYFQSIEAKDKVRIIESSIFFSDVSQNYLDYNSAPERFCESHRSRTVQFSKVVWQFFGKPRTADR